MPSLRHVSVLLPPDLLAGLPCFSRSRPKTTLDQSLIHLRQRCIGPVSTARAGFRANQNRCAVVFQPDRPSSSTILPLSPPASRTSCGEVDTRKPEDCVQVRTGTGFQKDVCGCLSRRRAAVASGGQSSSHGWTERFTPSIKNFGILYPVSFCKLLFSFHICQRSSRTVSFEVAGMQ